MEPAASPTPHGDAPLLTWRALEHLASRFVKHVSNPGIFIFLEFFGPGLGPGTRPDASGSPRYPWARGQSRIWSRFCRKR